MGRHKRGNPYEEGSLKTIYEKFIKPLIYYKPEDTNLRDWHEELFHLKYRDINRYKALRDFHIPGLYWDAPLRHIQGLGKRIIRKDLLVLVRHDHRDDFYDVQFTSNGEQVFRLSESEWNHIAPNLSICKEKK